jgi:hypothetical protein
MARSFHTGIETIGGCVESFEKRFGNEENRVQSGWVFCSPARCARGFGDWLGTV